MTSAKIKPIRPFNGIYEILTNLAFQNWHQHYDSFSLEIGCGAGLHPISWSQQHPKKGLIAIERTKNKYSSFKQRLEHHDCKNVFPVFGDASDWIPKFIANQQVEEYFFLYPNPYPKEKQSNKRWHRSPLTHRLLKTLVPGGRIHFATNEKFLFDEALLYATQFWGLKIVQQRSSEFTSWKPRTHFEKKYLLRGQVCYDVTFCKEP